MGSDIVLGKAKLHHFREYAFLCLPDEYMPRAPAYAGGTSFANQITFPGPANWVNRDSILLNAVQGGDNGNTSGSHAQREGLHEMLVFDPKAVIFRKPSKLSVGLEFYKDKDRSFEYNVFQQVHIESLRVWDETVRRVLYTMGNDWPGDDAPDSLMARALRGTTTGS